MTPEPNAAKSAPVVEQSAIIKLALELGPLVIFFLAYSYGQTIGGWFGYSDAQKIMVATAVFIPTMAASLLISRLVSGTLPVMPLVSFVLVAVFGGLTLWLQDETFIKMKPTILNLLFAAGLLGALAFGKLILKIVFEEGWSITDEGWRVLTIRWALFFIFMAVLNEVIWRNFSEEFWVNFKVWGNLPITMLFAVFQMQVVFKHPLPDPDDSPSA